MSIPSTSTTVTAEPLTVAYIALGAKAALQKLQRDNPAFNYNAHFEGEMNYIDRVLDQADLVETLGHGAEFGGVFLYEVAEGFGAEYGKSLFTEPLDPAELTARLIHAAA